jgi:hypothetical protein
VTFPAAPRLLETNQLLAGDESIVTLIAPNGTIWPLTGGVAPHPIIDSGVIVEDWKGLMAPFKMIDQVSARQDGATWMDTVWDPLELDFTVRIFGQTPVQYRQVQRGWMDAWDPKLQGKLVWFSRYSGEWFVWLRLLKEPSEQLKLAPAMQTSLALTWTARADIPFWQSFDSTSSLVASNATTLTNPLGGAHNFAPLWNRGDQSAWPRYILQGPGTFTIADGLTPGVVTFGPLVAGQTALIATLPSKRSVIDLTSGANLYPLMKGRFDNPLPASPVGAHIAVTVTGAATSVTQVNASLTPLRKWPE